MRLLIVEDRPPGIDRAPLLTISNKEESPMQHLYRFAKTFLGLACLVLFLSTGAAVAQTTTFSYQGRLTEKGKPVNAILDLQFSLYDTATVGTGTLQGSPKTVTNGSVQ